MLTSQEGLGAESRSVLGVHVTYQECFDVPRAALKDAKVFVEESMSFDDTRANWAIR